MGLRYDCPTAQGWVQARHVKLQRDNSYIVHKGGVKIYRVPGLGLPTGGHTLFLVLEKGGQTLFSVFEKGGKYFFRFLKRGARTFWH